MNILDAKPGARIIERHKQATPKTVIEWEVSDKLRLIVENDDGRRTKISAANILRYDVIKTGDETA